MNKFTKADLNKIKKKDLITIVLGLLNDKFQSDIIDTDMKSLKIGEGKDYSDERDWQDCIISEYLD